MFDIENRKKSVKLELDENIYAYALEKCPEINWGVFDAEVSVLTAAGKLTKEQANNTMSCLEVIRECSDYNKKGMRGILLVDPALNSSKFPSVRYVDEDKKIMLGAAACTGLEDKVFDLYNKKDALQFDALAGNFDRETKTGIGIILEKDSVLTIEKTGNNMLFDSDLYDEMVNYVYGVACCEAMQGNKLAEEKLNIYLTPVMPLSEENDTEAAKEYFSPYGFTEIEDDNGKKYAVCIECCLEKNDLLTELNKEISAKNDKSADMER